MRLSAVCLAMSVYLSISLSVCLSVCLTPLPPSLSLRLHCFSLKPQLPSKWAVNRFLCFFPPSTLHLLPFLFNHMCPLNEQYVFFSSDSQLRQPVRWILHLSSVVSNHASGEVKAAQLYSVLSGVPSASLTTRPIVSQTRIAAVIPRLLE